MCRTFLKPLISLIMEPDGQGRGSTFKVCYALLKDAILINSSLVAYTLTL
jgi:hypothetical protein